MKATSCAGFPSKSRRAKQKFSSANETGGEFQNQRFAGAAFAEENFCFALRDFEGNPAQDVAFIETERDIAKNN